MSGLAGKTVSSTRENAAEILRGADIIAGSVNRDAADVGRRATENMNATIGGYREE